MPTGLVRHTRQVFGLRRLCCLIRLDILTTCQFVVGVSGVGAVIRIGSFVDTQLLYAHVMQFVLRPQVFLAVGVWIGEDVLQV